MFDLTKKEIIEALGMSKQTFYKYFPELEEYEVVKVSRRIGKAKLYKINLEHPLVKMLREYEKKASMQIAQKEANRARKLIIFLQGLLFVVCGNIPSPFQRFRNNSYKAPGGI